MMWFNGVPLLVMVVVVSVQWGVDRCPPAPKTACNPSQGFRGAKCWMVVGLMADFLAFDCILLVGEGELYILESEYDSLVIQRCTRGEVVAAIDAEFDVLKFERFAPSVAGSFDVLGGAQEPEIGDNDKVDDMGVEGPPPGVFEVQAVEQGFDDADVGGVGTSTWVVFVAEGPEESSE